MAFKRRQGAQLGAFLGAPFLGRALSLSLALAFSLLSLQSVGFLLGPRRAALTSLAVAAPGVAWAESLELKSPKSIKELAAGSKKLEDALRPGIQKSAASPA